MRIHRSIALLALPVLAIVASTSLFHGSAKAVTAANWKPGRIIDDVVFFNKDAMSVAQIQAFLDAKVPTCNRWHSSSNPNYQPPYTCLKEYRENTSTGVSNIGQFDSSGNPVQIAGGKSAAQIIWDASQAYTINPQVLLVLLQKEQSLITDDWPWLIQYQHATGYSCPDTAPCNPAYAGFYRQVDGAAWQFRRYATYPDNYAYDIGLNNILWSPNSSCGSSQVNIENRATAMLYIYTPYQPNQAALNNLYGTGDGCSAYGNRNFWRMFSDWFGTTYGPEFSAQYFRQSSFPAIQQGGESIVSFDFKNTGNVGWLDEVSAGPNWTLSTPARLSTTNPINRKSKFSLDWSQPARPTGIFTKVYESNGVTLSTNQHVVMPGQIGRFEFTVGATNDMAPGVYREWFQPIVEGSTLWNMGGAVWMDFTVVAAPTEISYHSQSAHKTLPTGESSVAYIQYVNSGDAPWYDDLSDRNFYKPIHLATTNTINRSSIFGSSWGSLKNRPNLTFTKVYESNGVTLSTNQHVVMPGQIGRFEFTVGATNDMAPGVYREWFQPIVEGSTLWNMGGAVWMDFTVVADNYSAQYAGQSAYPTLLGNSSSLAYIMYKNTGNVPWRDKIAAINHKPIHLATTNTINRSSIFGSSWGSLKNRPNLTFTKVYESNGVTLSTNQHVVMPGQIGRFEFTLSVPNGTTPNAYYEWFELVREGSPSWSVNNSRAWLRVTVIP